MNRLLTNRRFLFLLCGQAASGLGGTFATVIMSWLVYKLTGSLIAMGSIWVAQLVPSLITQLLSGPYLDRWDRKKVMIASEWLRATAFLLPTIAFLLESLHIWQLFLTAIIIGIAEPLFRPASMAYVAEILPNDQLTKGNSLLEGTMQMMFLIGPALGGFILEWAGPQAVLFLLVGTMSGAGFILLFLPQKEGGRFKHKDTWWTEFKAGLQFYRINPALLAVGLLLMLANFTSGAASPMYLPFITEIIGGSPFQYGLFTSALSFGMIIASIATGVMKETKNRRPIMLGSMLMIGASLAVLGFVHTFPLALITITFMGFFIIIFNINNTTLYQRKVPDELRGRVFAVRILLAQSGIPLGAFVGGILAEKWGIPVLFNVMGGLVVIVTIISFFVPIFYQLNDTSPATVPVKPRQNVKNR